MCKLPYLPEGKKILYAEHDHEFMKAAKLAAESLSLDPGHKIGSVIVKEGAIIGRGGNGSKFHQNIGCIRKMLHVPTGKGYWLCPGCQTHHHSEQTALKDVRKNGHNPEGADIYLWGHWWCCQSCWGKMIEAGINNVYLAKDAEKLFKK